MSKVTISEEKDDSNKRKRIQNVRERRRGRVTGRSRKRKMM